MFPRLLLFYIGMGLLETDCRTCAAGRASENRKRHQRPGCGSQRPLRDRPCGTRVLLAAAPTAPPCFGRRPRSSPLPETWAGCKSTLPTNHRCFILKCPGGQPRFFSLAAAASRIIFTQVSRPRAALMARS